MTLSSTSLSLVAARSGDQDKFEEIWCKVNAIVMGFPFETPFIDILHSQFAMKIHQYSAQFPHFKSMLLLANNTIVGYVWFTQQQSNLHIIDLQILPEAQNQGFGGSAITTVINEYNNHSLQHATLTVERANPAYRLYVRLGFEPVSEDEVFISMQKPLK